MPGSDLNIFDAEFAINQFSGNQSLLIQILEKFNKQYQHFDTVIEEQLQQNERLTAKQQVHTLKGVSGNLGMKALHHACKEFEDDLANALTEQNLGHFLQVFKQTLSTVQNYSAESSIKINPEPPPQQNDKTALITALKRSEFISDSKMQSYMQSLDFPPKKQKELEQAIDDLDYARAIQLLE